MVSSSQLLAILFIGLLWYGLSQYYLRRWKQESDNGGTSLRSVTQPQSSPLNQAISDPPSSRLCRACHTKNDLFYTYCKHCISELPRSDKPPP
ncbi:DUF7577 domain-containing protein [Halalkalicoccus subterraneus]